MSALWRAFWSFCNAPPLLLRWWPLRHCPRGVAEKTTVNWGRNCSVRPVGKNDVDLAGMADRPVAAMLIRAGREWPATDAAMLRILKRFLTDAAALCIMICKGEENKPAFLVAVRDPVHGPPPGAKTGPAGVPRVLRVGSDNGSGVYSTYAREESDTCQVIG